MQHLVPARHIERGHTRIAVQKITPTALSKITKQLPSGYHHDLKLYSVDTTTQTN
jgi:hypothetical protein